MIHVFTPIPIGHTMSEEYQNKPFRSLIFARWVLDYHDELKGLWKSYVKQYKDEITFPNFCKVYFEKHRDITEPHLN